MGGAGENMPKFILVLLSFVFLISAQPFGYLQPAQAEQCRVVGVKNGQPILKGDCSPILAKICSNGVVVYGSQTTCPTLPTPAPPAAAVQKCPDGTVVPAETAAKGVKAVQAWCTTVAAGTSM